MDFEEAKGRWQKGHEPGLCQLIFRTLSSDSAGTVKEHPVSARICFELRAEFPYDSALV
jgi:hypothetical protein